MQSQLIRNPSRKLYRGLGKPLLMESSKDKILLFILGIVHMMMSINFYQELHSGNPRSYSNLQGNLIKIGIVVNWWNQQIRIFLGMKELYIQVILIGYLYQLLKKYSIQTLIGWKELRRVLKCIKLNDNLSNILINTI